MMRNEKSIFSDGVYTVWSNSDVKIGDEVELTTAEFEYDAVDGSFQNNLQHCYSVDVEIVAEDLTNFVAEKSSNGGAYGYATAKVLEVEEVIE